MRKDPSMLLKMYIFHFSPHLPKRAIQPFARVTVHWGRGNNERFLGLLDDWSELTRIPGNPKHHCGPPVRIGAYGGQVINKALPWVLLKVGPVSPQTHSMVLPPILECVFGIDMLSSWQNPHIGFLTCGGRAIMVEKAKWKSQELPLH